MCDSWSNECSVRSHSQPIASPQERAMDPQKAFIKHISHPFFLWKWGDSGVLRYCQQMEQSQFFSVDDLRTLQLQRLRAVIDQAYRRCPYYRERFDSVGIVPSDVQ